MGGATLEALNPIERTCAVLVSYHTGPTLFSALDAVLAQPEVTRVVLVDNGNPPDVRAELAARAAGEPRLELVQGQGNVGFAAACNLGAARARESLLLLLNPDCLLPPGALGRLLEQAQALDAPWLLGPRLLNPDGSEQAGGRRRLLTPGLAVIEGLGLYRLQRWFPSLRRFNLHQEPLPPETLAVPVISGACMLLPLAAYRKLGGMDEGYFLHLEDVDFCLRFGRAGGRVYFCPSVAVTHHKSTSAASPLRVEWHKTRGFFRYFRRHFAGRYVPGVLSLVNLLILLRYLLLAAVRGLRRLALPWKGPDKARR